MKKWYFAKRCFREILRDPLSIFFGIAFPLILLMLLSLIQANVPVPLFTPDSLTPGIVVFSFSFLTLFSAMLLAKDRSSSFLIRLYASPLRAGDFLFGYFIPMLPMGILQAAVCFLAAIPLGLTVSRRILFCILVSIPGMVFHISLGLLLGSLLTDRQVGGICGALLTNLSAWLSGVWFDLNLLGETLKNVAFYLPFANAVSAARAAFSGNDAELSPALLIVALYALAAFAAASAVFRRKMKV